MPDFQNRLLHVLALLLLVVVGDAAAGEDPLRAAEAALAEGLAARAAGEHDQAVERLDEAARLFQAAGDGRAGVAHFHARASEMAGAGQAGGEAAMVLNAGQAYFGAGLPQEGERVMREGLVLAARAGAGQWLGRGGAMLAQALYDCGRDEDAIAEAEQALPVSRRVDDPVAVALASITLGKARVRLRRYGPAIQALKEGLAAAETAGFGAAVEQAVSHLAFAHYELGDLEAARPWYEAELEVSQRSARDPDRIDVCYQNLAVIYWELADYDALDALLTRGFERAEHAQRPALRAELRVRRAHLAILEGQQREGLRAFVEAEREFRELGRADRLTDVYLGIGEAYARMGRAEKGVRYLQKRLQEIDSATADGGSRQDQIDRARLLIDTANKHCTLGHFDEALDGVEAAVDAAAQAGDELHVNAALTLKGTILWALGSPEQALGLFRSTHEAFQRLGDTRRALQALGNIGVILHDLGDSEAALETVQEALALARERKDVRAEMHHLSNAAALLHENGRSAEAQALSREALALAESHGGPEEMIETRLAATDLVTDREERVQALRKIAEDAHSYRITPREVDARHRLARLLLEGEPDDALREAQAAARELEELLGGLGDAHGTSARRRYAGIYEVGALAAARLDRPVDAFRMLEQGRAGLLVDALRARDLVDWDELPPELQAAQAKARVDVTRAQSRVAKVAEGRELAARREAAAELERALAQARDVADRIQRAAKRQADLAFPRVPPLREVQDALAEDQAFVVFGMCRGEVLAVVVGAEDERIVPLGTESDLRRALEALVLDDPEVDATAALEALRERIVTPLALGDEVAEVIISPDGALCQASLGLVFDTRSVVMTPSATTFAQIVDGGAGRGGKVLALGDPVYGEGATAAVASVYVRNRAWVRSGTRAGHGLAPLPGTRAEVEAVGDVVLLGAEATERAFRSAVATRERWRAVHFACHGLVNPTAADLCALAVTPDYDDDGFLTTLELLQMEVPADLAVLSACDTGRGQVSSGEGLLGLARSFLHAGAARVLCSLWKVDDEATKAFMTRFYELWNPEGGEGLEPAEALRQAQAHVRSQSRWEHPYYWAAWVLWGLP